MLIVIIYLTLLEVTFILIKQLDLRIFEMQAHNNNIGKHFKDLTPPASELTASIKLTQYLFPSTWQ